MAEEKIDNLIKSFLEDNANKICPNKEDQCNFNYDIYNEFSLQHELGIYLRKSLGDKYKVLFEKNVKYICDKEYSDWQKKEIDIVILKKDDKGFKPICAIELKFPTNGQYPEQMKQFIKDMKFMEQVKDRCHISKTYCLTLVSDIKFYSDKNGTIKNSGIYEYFRQNKVIPNNIEILCPIKDNKTSGIILSNPHQVNWQHIDGIENVRYYIDINLSEE